MQAHAEDLADAVAAEVGVLGREGGLRVYARDVGFDRLARVRVEKDARGLPRADPADVTLGDEGAQVDFAEVDDGKDRRPDGDDLARLGRARCDRAVEGRGDLEVSAVGPRLLQLREGSLALGATQWQTIWKQVLPGSIAGIATGVILSLSRAIGETAPLLVIGAAVSPRFVPNDLLDSFTALPIQIFAWTQDPNREFVDLAAAAILVLMAALLVMNSVAIFLRNRYEQKW